MKTVLKFIDNVWNFYELFFTLPFGEFYRAYFTSGEEYRKHFRK